MNESTYFKLHAVGEIPATYAALVLHRIEDAYVGLSILDELTRLSTQQLKAALRHLEIEAFHSVLIPEDLAVFPSLQLKGVVLQSPGFWEFLGKLNPLEVIRLYLNDRHARQKDTQYRNRIEEQKGILENGLLKVKLLSDFVDLARRAGLAEAEIAGLLRDNAHLPLMRLNALQDQQVISRAEIPERKSIEEFEDIDA